LLLQFEKYNSPGTDQIPGELIQTGGEILQSEIHKLIHFLWSKKELHNERNESIIVPITRKAIKLTAVIIVG
jgi:hypothetical protein